MKPREVGKVKSPYSNVALLSGPVQLRTDLGLLLVGSEIGRRVAAKRQLVTVLIFEGSRLPALFGRRLICVPT